VSRSRTWWAITGAVLLGLCGYFGPWVPHPAAGLNVPGLDLSEYVKFLPEVRSGAIPVMREVFYLPLLAGSISAAVLAGRRALPRALRILLALAAIPLALMMLPPAWTPASLRLPEFRLQVAAIVLCLALTPIISTIRPVPDRPAGALIALLSLSCWLSLAGFLAVRPAVAELYRAPLAMGWGAVAAALGFGLAALLGVWMWAGPRRET